MNKSEKFPDNCLADRHIQKELAEELEIMYDIVFISYKEPNADEVYAKLKETIPMAKRVHGVDGIPRSRASPAKKMFYKNVLGS